MIEFSCHNCGKAFRMDSKYAGRKASCKKCGTSFTIPHQQKDNEPEFAPPPPREEATASRSFTGQTRPQQRPSRQSGKRDTDSSAKSQIIVSGKALQFTYMYRRSRRVGPVSGQQFLNDIASKNLTSDTPVLSPRFTNNQWMVLGDLNIADVRAEVLRNQKLQEEISRRKREEEAKRRQEERARERNKPKWYLAKGDKQYGPISDNQLNSLAREGDLSPGDILWKEGFSQWFAASTIDGIELAGDGQEAGRNASGSSPPKTDRPVSFAPAPRATRRRSTTAGRSKDNRFAKGLVVCTAVVIAMILTGSIAIGQVDPELDTGHLLFYTTLTIGIVLLGAFITYGVWSVYAPKRAKALRERQEAQRRQQEAYIEKLRSAPLTHHVLCTTCGWLGRFEEPANRPSSARSVGSTAAVGGFLAGGLGLGGVIVGTGLILIGIPLLCFWLIGIIPIIIGLVILVVSLVATTTGATIGTSGATTAARASDAQRAAAQAAQPCPMCRHVGLIPALSPRGQEIITNDPKLAGIAQREVELVIDSLPPPATVLTGTVASENIH